MQDLVQLNDQLSRKELFDAFKVQLAKDFQQSNFPTDFVEALEPNYDRLHETIVRELQRSPKRADVEMMQLLYRVDISEGQLKRYLEGQGHENHVSTIAELIIKRVLQKVVIREYYRRRGNS